MANIIDFTALRNGRVDEELAGLQVGFLFDLFVYYKKYPALDLDALIQWLAAAKPPEVEGYIDESDVFKGWLIRRTVAEKGLASE